MTAQDLQAARRKVLIVSPHFAPINAPDMQRVRMALPYLRDNGWEPVVLAVSPESVEGGVLEPLLEGTYPADIRIVRVKGIPARLTRLVGVGSLWWRCNRALNKAGEKLLGCERFDLVFFSTTQFGAFSLGPRWKRKFGVPYVLDYQDPWINEYYKNTGTRPPGGKLKFGISQWSARRAEPKALRGASEVIAVSSAYGETLKKHYPWFDPKTVKFLPFGASEADLAVARTHRPTDPVVDFDDGYIHHVYTGRCGPDMTTALKILFRAFKHFLLLRPDEAKRIRFHFIGTDYAPRPFGREWVIPTAAAEDVGAYVSECCYRVPYFDALYYLTRADALIAIGSNDPTYSASKIFSYVLARRPLLVVFHRDSPVLALANAMKCGQRYSFSGDKDVERVAVSVAEEWFGEGKMGQLVEADLSAFFPYSAKSMTKELAKSFDEALEAKASST